LLALVGYCKKLNLNIGQVLAEVGDFLEKNAANSSYVIVIQTNITIGIPRENFI
jgi:hypothetical protein